MKTSLDVTRFFAAEYASLLCGFFAAAILMKGSDEVALIAAAWLFLMGTVFSVGAGHLLRKVTVTHELFAHHYRRLHAWPASVMNALVLLGAGVWVAKRFSLRQGWGAWLLVAVVAGTVLQTSVRLTKHPPDRNAREALGMARIGIVSLIATLLSPLVGAVTVIAAFVGVSWVWRRLNLAAPPATTRQAP